MAFYYSNIVSTIAILLSIVNLMILIYQNRTSVEMFFDLDSNSFRLSKINRAVILPIILLNRSKSDVSVVKIIFIDKCGKEYPANIDPQFIYYHFWKSPDTGTVFESREFTTQFPINLSGMAGKKCIIYVPFTLEHFVEFRAIKIITNKRTIKITKELHDLNLSVFQLINEYANTENKCDCRKDS